MKQQGKACIDKSRMSQSELREQFDTAFGKDLLYMLQVKIIFRLFHNYSTQVKNTGHRSQASSILCWFQEEEMTDQVYSSGKRPPVM